MYCTLYVYTVMCGVCSHCVCVDQTQAALPEVPSLRLHQACQILPSES